jgi:hypothetical protein
MNVSMSFIIPRAESAYQMHTAHFHSVFAVTTVYGRLTNTSQTEKMEGTTMKTERKNLNMSP